MYQELRPSSDLESIVDSYWIFTNQAKVENHKILPDGCMDIIFNLGNSTPSISSETINVSGLMTKFSTKNFGQNTRLFGIRFKPGQLNKLTGLPLNEVNNQTVRAQELIPQLNAEKLEKLTEQVGLSGKVAFIEGNIIKSLSSQLPNDPVISLIINAIATSLELTSISDLSKRYSISLRQLERRFKESIGVTMKEFSSIIRFHKAKRSIESYPNKSLLTIAFEYGYYDHAHLCREFLRLAGEVPSSFR